jgi:CRP-like cAMP-binding protein
MRLRSPLTPPAATKAGGSRPFTRQRSGNILLNCLDEATWADVRPYLTKHSLDSGQVLLEAAGPIETLWFPEGGVASFHEIRQDGSRVGVGIAGFEGLVGWSVLLGSKQSLHEATIAIGKSTALCIAAQELIRLCQERGSLNRLLLSYIQSFFAQMSRTILVNLHEPTERRLARWLLMNHDRLQGDEIALTHEQFGVMLGVRRASVTDTLHILEGLHLIKSVRGRVIIRDRLGLEGFAGEGYGAAEKEYARSIMPFSRQIRGSSQRG